MKKHSYPAVALLNQSTGSYHIYLPDLALFAEGETLEGAYGDIHHALKTYIHLATQYKVDIPRPSPLEQICSSWQGYTATLISA